MKTNDFLQIVTFIAFHLHVDFKIIKRSFSLQYQVNINAFNVAIKSIIMSPNSLEQLYYDSEGNANVHKCTCSNLYLCIFIYERFRNHLG